jgi:hypothetical protein
MIYLKENCQLGGKQSSLTHSIEVKKKKEKKGH